jgi:N-acetylneuraminic acid mutarotase
MAVGSFASPETVEAVDLSGNKRTCASIADYPGGIMGSTGTFIDGKALVCRGSKGDQSPSDECHSYNNVNNTWVLEGRLSDFRLNPSGVILNDSAWWVSGGEYQYSFLTSSDLYTPGQGFSPYEVILPEGTDHHEMIKINDSHVMMITVNGNSWLFDINSQNWTQLSNIRKYRASAGLVTYPNGEMKVVAVGGQDHDSMGQDYTNSSGIFSFTDLAWTTGPELPVPYGVKDSPVVQFQDSFLIVGGDYSDGLQYSDGSDKIFKFDTANDGWIELDEKLAMGRRSFAAFLVPDDYIECV